jgi:hypothetical protein
MGYQVAMGGREEAVVMVGLQWSRRTVQFEVLSKSLYLCLLGFIQM